MRTSKTSKKIRLNTEILRNLTPEQARLVAGGLARASKPYACQSSNDPTAC